MSATGMFRLADPWYLALLLPLAGAAWRMYRRRQTGAVVFSALHRAAGLPPTWRARLRFLPPILLLAGTALAIGALARPQTVFSRTIRHTDAIAIMMVVDCSGSMAALDFSTADQQRTRLDVVKETFAKFIAGRPNDLIGLIAFGGFASTRAPLTLDHAALLHSLRGVEIPRNVFDRDGNLVNQEEQMTAIGDALATACARLESAEVKSRVIVLLSDGESNTGIIKPEEAARAAKAMGIKVYTIGVGSNARAPFLARDVFGRPTIQYAFVTLDEALLRQLAATTGGEYFNVKDPQGLARAMASIDKLERSRIDTTLFNQYDEHFGLLLVPALILLAVGTGLNVIMLRAIA